MIKTFCDKRSKEINKIKAYFGVLEEHGKQVEWFIELGQPNADEEHSFSVESKEKALEIKDKLDKYFSECSYKNLKN